MKSISISVQGKVQGVAFRYYTLHKAIELNLSGFVRNQTDGSVYIEATGPEKDIEIFSLWCNYGPSRARVDTIDREIIEPNHQGTFQIR